MLAVSGINFNSQFKQNVTFCGKESDVRNFKRALYRRLEQESTKFVKQELKKARESDSKIRQGVAERVLENRKNRF